MPQRITHQTSAHFLRLINPKPHFLRLKNAWDVKMLGPLRVSRAGAWAEERLQSLRGLGSPQVDNEDLVLTLEAMVEKFEDEMAPFALGLTHHLAAAFWRALEAEVRPCPPALSSPPLPSPPLLWAPKWSTHRRAAGQDLIGYQPLNPKPYAQAAG